MSIIEKGIPLPERAGTLNSIYPFHDMEVGDSVFYEGEKGVKARTSAYTFSARRGFKFVARKENNGIRIWRIS